MMILVIVAINMGFEDYDTRENSRSIAKNQKHCEENFKVKIVKYINIYAVVFFFYQKYLNLNDFELLNGNF